MSMISGAATSRTGLAEAPTSSATPPVPIDTGGPVFIVDTSPNLDVRFNVWLVGGNTYAGFVAGNPPMQGGGIIYLGEYGVVSSIPEPTTGMMLGLGFAGPGFGGYSRARTRAIDG